MYFLHKVSKVFLTCLYLLHTAAPQPVGRCDPSTCLYTSTRNQILTTVWHVCCYNLWKTQRHRKHNFSCSVFLTFCYFSRLEYTILFSFYNTKIQSVYTWSISYRIDESMEHVMDKFSWSGSSLSDYHYILYL